MADSSKVRVRFAPSPTGLLHLGNIRTALFNWLYAHKTDGTFVLRLEDTDRERFNAQSIEQFVESLKWLELEPVEGYGLGGEFGPYAQSERLDIYKAHAETLIKNGWLYPCWCDEERLGKLRKEAESAHRPFKYDRHCLVNPGDLSKPHVLRFKIPENKEVKWLDLSRGEFRINSADIDDWVAIKSDGFPTYNFANVVDDHLMEISHVLRGDEFIASTPKHVLLYESFGWTPPKFVHLPQVLGKDKSKLSKRHGAKTVLEYRDDGYLPDGVVNFLALLGWNPGEGSTKEIYRRNELIEAFSLERIQKSPAVFDPERLDWMNGQYIRALTSEQLTHLIKPFLLRAKLISPVEDDHYIAAATGLVQDRMKKLSEAPDLMDFFFEAPKTALEKFDVTVASKILPAAFDLIIKMAEPAFTIEKLEANLRGLTEQLGLPTGKAFQALRLALTGKTAAPGLFETMAVLGQERVVARLKTAAEQVA